MGLKVNIKKSSKVYIGLGLPFAAIVIVFAFGVLLAYFTYGKTLDGILAFAVWAIFATVLMLLTLIPLGIGPIVYGLIFKLIAEPGIFNLTGIHSSWLTEMIFWIYIVIGFVISAITTFVLHMMVSN